MAHYFHFDSATLFVLTKDPYWPPEAHTLLVPGTRHADKPPIGTARAWVGE